MSTYLSDSVAWVVLPFALAAPVVATSTAAAAAAAAVAGSAGASAPILGLQLRRCQHQVAGRGHRIMVLTWRSARISSRLRSIA